MLLEQQRVGLKQGARRYVGVARVCGRLALQELSFGRLALGRQRVVFGRRGCVPLSSAGRRLVVRFVSLLDGFSTVGLGLRGCLSPGQPQLGHDRV